MLMDQQSTKFKAIQILGGIKPVEQKGSIDDVTYDNTYAGEGRFYCWNEYR